jgi:hypothetical protein
MMTLMPSAEAIVLAMTTATIAVLMVGVRKKAP